MKGNPVLYKILVIWISILFISVSVVSSAENIFEKNNDIYKVSLAVNTIKYSHPFETIWYFYTEYLMETGFYTLGPENFTRFRKWDGEDIFNTGTWTNDGKYLCCTYNNGTLYDINPKTLDVSLIGGGGISILGLAYDPVDEMLYGCGDDNYLYEIDPENGKQEKIGQFTGGVLLMLGIGIDVDGVLYGWDLSDRFWKIDKSSGVTTIIGSLGINISYAIDGDFDKIADCVYLIAYTTTGCLIKIDKTTGTAELVGNFEGNISPETLGISYELNMKPPVTTISFEQVKTNGFDIGEVYVFLNATDNTGVIDTFYRLNGEEWIKYESPFVISDDEKYIIEFYSYDYVGNIEDVNVCIYPENFPPGTPVIEGIRKFNEGEGGIYPYTFYSIDPDGDDILYLINWSDGSQVVIGPFISGEDITINVTIPPLDKGTYIIFEVKAKDIYGAESDWAVLEIEVPRTRASSYLWYECLFERFPLLERLLNLIK